MRIFPARWLLFVSFLLNCSLCISSEWNSLERHQKSTLRPVVERVFSRKKRWMIFPKGSSLKFTVSVSKRLLAMYPKGFTFNLEAAIYYPMPAARIDLIPKRFRKPTTKAPPHKGPTPLYLVGIPGSLIKYRAKPATKPAKVQRIDQNVPSLQWWPPSHSLNLYQNNSQKWSKYSSPEYLKNYQWSPEKEQKLINKYSKYNNVNWSNQYPNKYSFTHHRWNHQHLYSRDADKFEEPDSSTDDFEPVLFEELEPFENSRHYHSYRGRRELFYHFEGFSKLLGIDVKSCILRAVCDSKRFLLPPGYSMIQDILRVVFTFPTINGLKDDYSRITAADYQTCDVSTHNKCPFSILDWLLNSQKPV